MAIVLLLCNCVQRKAISTESPFTRADSLTEQYLELQDSILHAWNIMINDDNHKIKMMHELVNELGESNQYDRQTLVSLNLRLQELQDIRYDQKSIANTDIIADYDFLTNSLITELVSLAESRSSFADNKELQKMIAAVKESDRRVEMHRNNYDNITNRYNKFIQGNKDQLRDIDTHLPADERPLFQMTSAEN